jgi:acetolactate synthase-1/2/3 large subunit
MAAPERLTTGDPRWTQYPAEEWSDAIVAAMKLGGIENLFFVSGSEIAFYQESIAKAHARGRPAPRLLTITHEGVAINAAIGDAMVSGRPSACAVHVDVGTQNYGAGIHTAWRGPYPILMMSGTGPRAYPDSMVGARNSWVQWVQEPRDQGEILRQYTKADHRLEHQDNPGLIVSRLLQIAMSEPKGPVYMSVPRESAMLPLPGSIGFPTRDELGIAAAAWPDPADAKQAAQWLIRADNPCIYPTKAGRNPEAMEELVRLAELLAVPVMDAGRRDRLCFPTAHPLFGTGPAPRDADAVLVVENTTPFIPPHASPRPNAKVVWIDPDPVQSRYKTMEYQADLWLPVTAAAGVRAIYEAATGLLTQSDMNRIADRRSRLEARKREIEAEAERRGQEAGRRRPLHPRWVSYQLSKLLQPETILLDDTLGAANMIPPYQKRSLPGTYFSSGSSTGGWGPGAALGAKIARPDRDVVLTVGDGFFFFGWPFVSLWAAAHHKAPYLTVVYLNRSYSTGTAGVKGTYPEGVSAETENYEGGIFDPPLDVAKLAEAANCYGETVHEAEEVAGALQRGFEQVHHGRPAVIAAYLPTHVEEMHLPQ